MTMQSTPPSDRVKRQFPALRRLFRPTRAKVWGALLALEALVLAGTPLFDVLGFEFAFATGLLASLGAADLAAAEVTARRRDGDVPHAGPGWTIAALTAGAAARALVVLLAAPFVLMTLNALRV